MNSCYGNSREVVIVLQRCVCGKGDVGLKIIRHRQGSANDSEIDQTRKSED